MGSGGTISGIGMNMGGGMASGMGGGGGFTPIFTDDASTKLSDRVRRRCFNCCTTDTSTWRRSSLNPGKVVRTLCIYSHDISPPIIFCFSFLLSPNPVDWLGGTFTEIRG